MSLNTPSFAIVHAIETYIFRSLVCLIALTGLVTPLLAQIAPMDANPPMPALRVNSRAVLVDVIVTDRAGNPVAGLKQDAFAVTEQGKTQTVSFFEENGNTPPPAPVEMPKLPPDVFSNFSPFPQPKAVNVLLLDSLNTDRIYQVNMHSEVKKFLESAKPGTRSAIFTMGITLRLIQGFTDDPEVLRAALENRKNIEVETPAMMKSLAESNAQKGLVGMMSQVADSHGGTAASPAMTGALQNFFDETDTSQSSDRMLVTLANLQRLAAFLEGVPGRKNIIWFAQKVPAVFNVEDQKLQFGNPVIEDEIKKTLAKLSAERAAIYPVYPQGLDWGYADTVGSAMDRRSDQINAQLLAEQSGGRAFANTNAFVEVINSITSNANRFYTVSYSPKNAKMDGGWRKIDVKVAGGKFNLSYRRGYFAVDTGLPGSGAAIRERKVQALAAQNPGAVDPLLPFMGLGLPQSEQILYKVHIMPVATRQNEPAEEKGKNHYAGDFAIDLKDLNLSLDAGGLHKGRLNLSLIVYDRYENVVWREDHRIGLDIKPDAYAIFQSTGVQLHADLTVPNGNYWLRTGVYDQGSRKVGTMEVPLSSVVPLEVSAK